MKIHDIPKENRPREKAKRYGFDALTDRELLALLIGKGVHGSSALEIADSLLATFSSMYALSNTTLLSLKSVFGISDVKAINLLAAFEFHNRLNSPMYQKAEAINSPSEIYSRYQYLESYTQEVLILIMLDKKHRILSEKMLYKGTSQTFSLNVKEILTEILLARSYSFILIHNHPDGENLPSDNDVFSTIEIENKANELDVKLLDHVIIYRGGYYSFKQNGLLSLKS